MHTADVLFEIHRLICAGQLSQREIAARLEVSRGTVSAVANGRRSLDGRESRRTYSPLTPTTPPVRCRRCGYRVYLPCMICRVREHHERQRMLQLMASYRIAGAAKRLPNEYRSAPRGAA